MKEIRREIEADFRGLHLNSYVEKLPCTLGKKSQIAPNRHDATSKKESSQSVCIKAIFNYRGQRSYFYFTISGMTNTF